MKNVCVLGCGRLGQIIADGLHTGKVKGCRLEGVMDGNEKAVKEAARKFQCRACTDIEELMALKPDYVVEAATAEAVKTYAMAVLSQGAELICLSVGAFYDEEFRKLTESTALRHKTKVHLASGVLGGFDFMTAAAMYGRVETILVNRKQPSGSPKCPPGLTELPDRYQASVEEAYQMSPRHLNIGIAVGLACGDFKNTQLSIEPAAPDEYTGFAIHMKGDFGKAELSFQQGCEGYEVHGPLMAAWSALALLERLTSPISF